jgi:hypothetical protein
MDSVCKREEIPIFTRRKYLFWVENMFLNSCLCLSFFIKMNNFRNIYLRLDETENVFAKIIFWLLFFFDGC